MHTHTVDAHRHDHVYLGAQHEDRERRTWIVVGLTIVMMVFEIAGGWLTGSMALMADGWHMSTHAAALGIAGAAYRLARSHALNPRFAFGTGKMGELAGYTSALLLAVVAALILYESLLRLIEPEPIAFEQAMLIAVIGLVVNLGSAWLLGGDHGHDHGHGHGRKQDSGHSHSHDHDDAHHDHSDDHGDHDHGHAQHGHGEVDNNMRAAYVHVLTDALTSVLAIVALAFGWLYGWNQLDAVVGVLGAIVIGVWAIGLMRSAGSILLDVVPSDAMTRAITGLLEKGTDRVTDLHVWRLGPGHAGVIASVISDDPQPPEVYKQRLAGVPGLSHVTIEVQRCRHATSGSGPC